METTQDIQYVKYKSRHIFPANFNFRSCVCNFVNVLLYKKRERKKEIERVCVHDSSWFMLEHSCAHATSPRSPYAAAFLGGGLNVGTSAPSSKSA